MTHRPWASWARSAIVGMAMVCAMVAAHASGDPGPYDEYVVRSQPGHDVDAYEAGQLGVVLPGFERIYLYTAWRAIVLGAEGYAKVPHTPGALQQAAGAFAQGWTPVDDEGDPVAYWLKVSQSLAPRKAEPTAADRIAFSSDFASYVNCPSAAFGFAAETLKKAAQRSDASPQRLSAWVGAQDAVFGFCNHDPERAKNSERGATPTLPGELPGSEPAYWRQLREYQIAAAHFYKAHLAEAARRFAAIGKTPDHPMRVWGAYLALRAQLRQATLADTPLGSTDQESAAAPLLAQVQRILADPTLEPVHEATRATARTLQFRLTPRRRWAELTAALADPQADPYVDDRLGDWRRVANLLLEEVRTDDIDALEDTLRKRHDHYDWIRTMQRCGLAGLTPERTAACGREAPRARALWQRWGHEKAADAAGRARAWLFASLVLTDQLDADLEQAALAVAPNAPEYLSVRYQLTRLYRLAGRSDRAREFADGALGELRRQKVGSLSAENLFKQERFALATSLKDAVDHLMRRTGGWRVADTGEAGRSNGATGTGRPASDGIAWINTRLATTDLLALAQDERLPRAFRAQIAVSAWFRADVVEADEQAMSAAALAAQLAPALGPSVRAYRAAKGRAARRHSLVLSALSLRLSPLVRWIGDSRTPWSGASAEPRSDDEALADMWCSVANNRIDSWDIDARLAEQTPPLPDVSTHPAARDREMAVLSRLKTATGFVSDHVLAWAQVHPADPEVPRLLYVVVQSTRGGCRDADASKASKAAFQLLHGRYKSSPWAAQTPYWY
ncbi:hypothetical protein AACH06_19030 [Ideonella sp. DXS29W]|uniref:Uncharacterized protein n=1 Tax=Ideonella lacteola TaxID=2984193 RepID=A0ABU9BSH2_9BURK